MKYENGLLEAKTCGSMGTQLRIRGHGNLMAVLRKHFIHNDFFSLAIYDNKGVYFNWHDAPEDPMYVAGDIDIKLLAEAFGSTFRRLETWQD